mgnify:CR=1 FL=1
MPLLKLSDGIYNDNDINKLLNNYFTRFELVGTTYYKPHINVYKVEHPDLKPGTYYVEVFVKVNTDKQYVVDKVMSVND